MLKFLNWIPGGFLITLPYAFIRAIYRRYRKQAIAENLEQKQKKSVHSALQQSVVDNQYSAFTELVDKACYEDLRSMDWESTDDHSRTADTFVQRYQMGNRKSEKAQWLSADYGIYTAWQIRGNGYADTVSEEAQKGFYNALISARKDAQSALDINPNYVPGYTALVAIAMGLGNRMDATLAFEAGSAIEPLNFRLHERYLEVLKEKWYGSHDEMFEFARSHYSDNSNSALNGLIALSHFEFWLGKDKTKAAIYLKQKNTQEELKHYVKPLLKGTSKNRGEDNIVALNYFALLFYYGDKEKDAYKVFQRIGNRFTHWPWMIFDQQNAARVYLEHKWASGA